MASPKKEETSAIGSGARAIIFLGIAVVAGLLATFIIWKLFTGYQQQIAQAQRPEDTQYVIVAYSNLYQGVTITEEDLYAIEVPPKFLHLGGAEGSGLFSSPEHVVGRVPRERILANEFLREERLADPQRGIGLNAFIPRGMRALSLNIGGGEALSGFLQPSNYVDVLVTITPEEGATGPIKTETHTLLEAVYVLAVGGTLRRDQANKPVEPVDPEKEAEKDEPKRNFGSPSVTLAVTPTQAEQLAHAFSQGTLTLTLRNDIDVAVTDLEHVTIEDIFGREKEEEKKPVRRPVKVEPKDEGGGLTIIQGGVETEWKFNADGSIKSK